MISRQKSAEGIVDGSRPVRVLRHSDRKAEQQINRTVVSIEGLNGAFAEW
jgi:hypothetical protein